MLAGGYRPDSMPFYRSMNDAIKPSLATDPTVRICTAIFLAVISFLLLQLIYPEQSFTYSRQYFDLPLLIMVIGAIQYRLQQIEDRFERRFWNLWTLGLIAWLLLVVFYLFTQNDPSGLVDSELVEGALFFLFYLLAAMGLESQPHRSAEHLGSRLRLFDWLSVFIFFLGLLLYFVVVPWVLKSETYVRANWVFYVVFDLYLSIRLAIFVHTAADRRWRVIYAWLLVATLLWLCSDGLGLVAAIGITEDMERDAIFDPILLASFLAIVIATRSREFFPDLAGTEPRTKRRSGGHLGPLVFYATMVPLMHFGIARTTLFDPALLPIRETLVLIFLVLLSLLVYVYQRLLEAENWRLEDTRLVTSRALDRSEARFRSAFESVTVGSIVIDSVGTVESFNPMAQTIFGYTPDEVVGKNIRMLMPESFAIEHDHYLQRYLQTKVARVIGVGREVTGLRKNGEEFPMHVGVGEMEREGGSFYIGSITDLTELKRIENQLIRTQKMDAIGQLTGGIAHDFNNILTIILGNLELLELQVGDDAKTAQLLGPIRKSALRAAELTQKLVVFSGHQLMIVAVTDINQLVAEMEGLISRSLTPEVAIEQHFAKDLWLTEINPGDLEDALVNLVLNARDAMPGGGTLTLETHNRILNDDYCAQNPGAEPGMYVELAVSDTGEGMSLEHQQRIFEPFFTTKDTGTGLGLAMVYGFTRRSKGYIKVYSELGVGTTFRFYLPRAEARQQPQPAADADAEALPRGTQTLLVVDDEVALLKLATIQLENLGYRVLVASDARQALQVLAAEPGIDLLFTDIVMPGGMNGSELAEQATRSHPGLRVLLASGFAEKAIARNGRARFAAKLLNKPYTVAELAKRVRAVLDDGLPVA